MKSNLSKFVALAGLGLALSPVAQAADLYVGFNDLAGGAGNDYVIDLGAQTGFTTSSTFSGSISSSLFLAAFGTDANALNNVAVGAVAGGQTGSGFYLFATGTPTASHGTVAWNNAKNAASNIPTGVYAAAGSATSPTWDFFVAQSPSSPDSSGTGVASEVGNPESSLVNGDVTLTLWQSTLATGLGKTPAAFTELGTLTIDANSALSDPSADSINYVGVNAVPEPSTYGILASGLVAAFGLRRKFFKKVA